MKPFLLLSIRPEQVAADNEYDAFRTFSGLSHDQLHRVQLTAGHLGQVNLAAWSGIMLGGGPFNASDPVKSPLQTRVEDEIAELLDTIIAEDFPFLGACYGIGTLGTHMGAVIDQLYGEAVGAINVTLTPEGRGDPLFEGLPDQFWAYGGHKEAVSQLPQEAVALATSQRCPVQAFKYAERVYATQFHPELDLAGLATRIDVYRNAGYFPPDAAAELIELAGQTTVVHPMKVLRNFVALAAGAGR